MFLSLVFVLFTQNAMAFTTTWQEASLHDNVGKLRVIGSYYETKNNEQKLIIGLHFKLNSGWKIYGKDSNGMGLPPSLDFKGSINIKNHEILWPESIKQKEKIGKETIEYGIYHDEIIIPVAIQPQDLVQTTKINLKINYGLCKDVCIPATTEFLLNPDKNFDEKSLQSIQKFLPQEIIVASPPANEEQAVEKITPSTNHLISALIAAALGGLILNIMPCVLPVLGIKVMSVINHSSAHVMRIRFAFFATILGIIFCFFVFAIFAALIGYTGNVFNWGLQFQNPYFLIFLIVILAIFIANMVGFFDITFDEFTANLLNREITRRERRLHQIFIPNFLSGILAVLLATPCSAPFLGSAISFSIMQNTQIIFLIFFAMGLGFALPYIILMISPKLIHSLPKPGNWMLRVKEIMAILLAATIIWLIYVLAHNIGNIAAYLVAAISAALLFAFRIKIRFLKILTFIALITAVFALPTVFEKGIMRTNPKDHIWKKFDEGKLHELVEQGNVVVIDVTADWCLTCKFNKINVLHDKEIMDKLTQSNIVAMRADITQPDQAVISFINHKGRYAIPFNAVYGPHAKEGLLTNELLNKKELLDFIEKAQ